MFRNDNGPSSVFESNRNSSLNQFRPLAPRAVDGVNPAVIEKALADNGLQRVVPEVNPIHSS